jgi:hypothetical protein
MSIEEIQEIYINNIIPSGSGFALNPAGVQVYIPVTVTKFFNLQVGETAKAALIPNKNEKNLSTPYMAVRIIRDAPAQPAPLANDENLEARITRLAAGGDVWSQGKMFAALFPGTSRDVAMTDYNRIGYLLRKMHENGVLARVSLWRTAGQTKPGREWFTADPDWFASFMESDDDELTAD